MRKLYFLIMLVCLLLVNSRLLSQCLKLTGKKTEIICNNTFYTYTAAISVMQDYGTIGCKWVRPYVDGITNAAGNGGQIIFPGSSLSFTQVLYINETLQNTTSQPVVVTYIFTFSGNQDCNIMDSIKVTVNPTPMVNRINDTTFCNGAFVKGINFNSNSLNASFKWTSDKTIGFGTSGSDRIPDFTATNNGSKAVVALITVSITVNTGQCPGPGPDSTFTITVNPSPPKPGFRSLSRYPDTDTVRLCSGSENINFNVNSPATGIAYHWTSTANRSMVAIRDTNDANTVISFYNTGNDTINLMAKDMVSGCTNTVSQIVQVMPTPTGIDKRKIFLSQPGNLLIYPNNSLTAYQWGYDSVIHTLSDSSFGPSVPVTGQVYQYFIPEGRFIDNSTHLLNETNYLYWVMLRNGDCTTKIYYNGPYANRIIGAPPADSTVQLQIVPNPNNGTFTIALKGNIYGNIHAEMCNTVGRTVFSKNFKKVTPDIIEQIHTNHLPAGLYFLVLYSSDLKKVSTRIVIQR